MISWLKNVWVSADFERESSEEESTKNGNLVEISYNFTGSKREKKIQGIRVEDI